MEGMTFGTFAAEPLAGASPVEARPSTSTPPTAQAQARVNQPGTASVDEVMAEPERGNALADPVIKGADSHNTASTCTEWALLLPPTGWTELQQVRVSLA
jgi:hypothetical protein